MNSETSVLVNDLDLRLRAPDGVTLFHPYLLDPDTPDAAATTGDNVRDPVEQIRVANPPQSGVYTLEITFKGSLADNQQTYSLIVGGQTLDNLPVPPDPTVLLFR